MRRKWLGIPLGCAGGCLGMVFFLVATFTLAISPWVWLPDLFDQDGDIVAQASSPNGDRFYVVQRWYADFYCTFFVHKPSQHVAYWYVLDPDGWRARGGTCTLHLAEGSPVVAVYMTGNLFGSYDYMKRDCRDYRGFQCPALEQDVEELPRTPEGLP